MADRTLRVLSIDGGGVRAHLGALVLAEVERRAGRPVAELFDLVVGTSTGGIIGLGAAVGVPAAELAEFFPRCGARIFGRRGKSGSSVSLEQRLEQSSRSLGALFSGGSAGPRYRPDGLEAVLRDVFGDTRLAQVDVPVAATTFDATSSVPVVLASRDAVANPIFDLALTDVARATSAAPGIFPALTTTWAAGAHAFVDGGVWATNPAAVALSEALALAGSRGTGAESIVMVSLGTGAAPGVSIAELNRSWLGDTSDRAGVAASAWAGEVLARRTIDPANFHRFQVVDPRIVGAMDDAGPQRLSSLHGATHDWVGREATALDAALAQLCR